MDRALSFRHETESTLQYSTSLKRSRSFNNPKKPFSAFSFWVSKSLKNLSHKAKLPNGVGGNSKRFEFDGMVMYNSVYCVSPCILNSKMESFVEKSEEIEAKIDGVGENVGKIETFVDGNAEECRESCESSDFLASEVTLNEEHSSSEVALNEEHSSSEDSSSTPSMVWPIMKSSHESEEVEKPHLEHRKLEKQGSSLTEVEMMKERFAKLLLGEDMSGCGNGVCTALAISNAITNLCATLFGQIWRLEPLHVEKKLMWRREMDWLLCVSDHIVELIPSWQTFPDGSKLEVMTSRPRADLYINLPALRKLDNMLLEILETFENTEFWYVDQGIVDSDADGSSSFRKPLPSQEDKWWLPVPRVPNCGLSENARKDLQHRRDCTNQILKATMAINSNILAEMEVPESYLEALPKNAKASLGDLIHRYINSEQFSPECLLECLDLSSEYQALEIANRVEASIYIWRRRTSKPLNNTNRSNSKSSWGMVKDLVTDGDKREQLADKAESLLLCLKQSFPGLPQTTLDMSKIQYNKDVGKSILESYSRVLESLAFNIVARIDDLVYVDDLTKHSDQSVSITKVGLLTHKSVGIPLSVPVPGTPYKTAFTTPTFSPAQRISPATGGKRSQFLENNKNNNRGYGVKKILTDYLMIDSKAKDLSNEMRRSGSLSSTSRETSAAQSTRSSECSKEAISTPTHDTQAKE